MMGGMLHHECNPQAQQLAATQALLRDLHSNFNSNLAATAAPAPRSPTTGGAQPPDAAANAQLTPSGPTLLAGSLRLPGAVGGKGAPSATTAADQQLATMGVVRDLEARVRKLGGQIKQMQMQIHHHQQMQAAGAGGSPTEFAADSDHAMLSSRPAVFGYRCMACDRPLAALDERPGPWVPGGAMPLPQLPAPWDAPPLFGAGGGEVGGARARSAVLSAAARRRTDGAAVAAISKSWDGVQQTQQQPAAAELPGSLLGPRLPPGGWRGGVYQQDSGGALPQIAKGRTPATSTRATREG